MSNLHTTLKKIAGKPDLSWKEDAKFRIAHPWLHDYSSQIARRILAVIHDNKNLNQAILAGLLNVSAQHISKIVQGRENLTLETIYKLSKALNVELITFPEYKYSVVQPKSNSEVLLPANNLAGQKIGRKIIKPGKKSHKTTFQKKQ